MSPDNRDLAALTGNAALDEVTYSGDTAVVQLVRNVQVTGAEGSKTVVENMPASLGQKTKAGSFPVTIASDEGSHDVSATIVGTTVVAGGIGHGAADAVSPVKVGGRYVASPTGVTDGDVADALTDQFGQQRVIIGDPNDASLTAGVNAEGLSVRLAGHAISVPLPVFLTDSGGDGLNPLPVSGTVAVTGVATETTLAAVKTALELIDTVGAGTAATAQRNTLASDDPAVVALQIIDDWDETDRAKVNIIAGQVGVAAGAGAVSALTQRTTLASDDPAVVALQLIDDAIFAEDAVSASGNKGVAILAVRRDNDSIDTSTDGDYTNLLTDQYGRLRVTGVGASFTVVGDVTHDNGDTGNPVKIGSKAASALPTAAATDDRVNAISDLFGRLLVSHIDPAMQITKAFNATTTQTGIDVWDPAGGKKIAITDLTISTYGTTAARVILWFGDNADTTYSAGTDQVLEIASFAPSATAKHGMVKAYSVPVFCTTADRELHITTDAGISIDVTVRGYEW